MKKYIILPLILLLFSFSYAQKVSYEVIENYTRPPLLTIGLIPLTIDGNSSIKDLGLVQLNAEYGVDARLRLGNILLLQARAKRSYIDFNKFLGDLDGVFNKEEMSDYKPFHYEVGAEIRPFIRRKNSQYRITTEDNSTYSATQINTRQKFFFADGTRSSFLGFRGGLIRYQYNIHGDFITEDGNLFQSDGGNSYGFGRAGGTLAYAGIVKGSSGYLKAKVNGYRILKGEGGIRRFYADVLYGLDIFASFDYQNQQQNISETEEGSVLGNNRLGFRTGLEGFINDPVLGIGYRAEVSMKPGYGKVVFLTGELIFPLNIGKGKDKSSFEKELENKLNNNR